MTKAMKSPGKVTVWMAVLLGASCQGGAIEPSGQATGQALTAAQIDRVLGFESAADWAIINGGQGTLATSTTHSQGTNSLAATVKGFVPIQSIALSSLGTRVKQHIQFDLRLPTAQPNPYWYGTTQVSLDCPSRKLYSAPVGTVELSAFPLDQWWTVDMTLTSAMVTALGGTYSDLRITVVLNVPTDATGTYLVDNLRFSASAAPAGACDAGNYKPKAAGTVCRAANGACDSAEVCTGSSLACPADVYRLKGTVCRAATDLCDNAEVCSGTSTTCPADTLLAKGTICRPVAGLCDVAETCSGTSKTCPTDLFVKAGQVCRPSTGSCDPAESCTGKSAACPPDVKTTPPVPTGLAATAGSGQVSLTWAASTGATSYNLKRSTTTGGPYTTVASVATTSYLDAGRAIGPTYHYVVTAVGSCGESAASAEATATPFSDKTGTFPPGPGGDKMAPALVVVPTAQDVIARYGAAAKGVPSQLPGTVGTDPKLPKPTMRLATAAQHYARIRYEMKFDGAQTAIVPRFAAQIEGALVLPPAVAGQILVVGRSGGSVNFVTTIKDPRMETAMAVGEQRFRRTGGSLQVNLPEMFLNSGDLLQSTVFEFYSMAYSVPVTTPVSVATLPTLLSGATLVATSSGTSLYPVLFPPSP